MLNYLSEKNKEYYVSEYEMEEEMIISMMIVITVMMGGDETSKIEPSLFKKLKRIPYDQKVSVIVTMAENYPYESIKHLDEREKAQIFKSVAENSQRKLIEYLNQLPKEKVELTGTFWVFNGLHLKATKGVIKKIVQREDVKFIELNKIRKIVDPVPEIKKILLQEGKGIEWNIKRVKADSCWIEGYDGTGIIIGHIDTGVNPEHPALQGKWAGYWLDAVNGQSGPYDDGVHGTHTMGIILGGDGPGPFEYDIGVAPGVKYVAAKAFTGSGTGQDIWIDQAMQWMVDLKADSGVDIKAVSNSWGYGDGTYTHYWDAVLTWKSLGIVPVFANGNSGGNGAGTVNAPASYPTTFGVGATDSLDNITPWSSKGPAPDQAPFNDPQYWYTSDWNLLKPDMSAPGDSILSSVSIPYPPYHIYYKMSGTSMAAPHVTGAIAIIAQKNPDLSPTDYYLLLTQTTYQPSQGNPYPNYDYGYGIINIYHALQDVKTKEINIQLPIPNSLSGIFDITGRRIQRQVSQEIFKESNISQHKLKKGTYFIITEGKTTKVIILR